MLKQSASLSCSFGLFGLSGLFGCMRLTRWTRQTGLVPHVGTIEVLLCQNGFSAACEAGNCCYRSFASVASNVFILLRMFSSPASPGHHTGRSGRHDGHLRKEPVWHCRS